MQPTYSNSDHGSAPPASNLHSADRLVVVACDSACIQVAETLVQLLKKEAANTNRVVLEVEMQPVMEGEHHSEVLMGLVQKHPHIPSASIFVLSFIKDGNPDEYKTVKQWAQSVKPPLPSHVITCTSAMQDPSLLIRNVTKAVIMKLTT
eukprot:TRINITY_DN271_c7_g1_i1.p1 TRINITY_DN271_c7_g1~~TRINITY_DN271_c7_g1_i1.p1  ORF type:complete len:149 (+),score=19.42 TRINITY_DN271_c7_g1_i1:84-530(+)